MSQEELIYLTASEYDELYSAYLQELVDNDVEAYSVSPEVCKQPGGPKGFSAIASCRAQGLIPRADGTYRKSKKYQHSSELSEESTQSELDLLAEKYGLRPGGLRKWFSEQTPPKSVRERIEKKTGEPFKGGWVRVSATTGEIIGPCGRRSARDSNEGYPKCMSYQTWKSLTKKERINAVRRKRRNGVPGEGTGNKPKFVKTKLSSSISSPREWDGLKLFVEYQPGDVHPEHKTLYHDFYGYFEDSNNLDSEELDFYHTSKSNPSNKVFIIYQINPSGGPDELKVMLGYESQNDAINSYLKHVPIQFFGSIQEINSNVLRSLIKIGNELKLSNSVCIKHYFDNSQNSDLPIKYYLSKTSNENQLPMLKIPIARLGSWVHSSYKEVKFTQKDFDEIKENFANKVLGFPPYIRYGHSKFPDAVDAEAAIGEIKEIIQEGEYLYSLVAPHSEKVVEEIKTKQYRFSSPELVRNFIDKNTGKNLGTVLIANALTNAPFLPNLPQNQVLSTHCPDSSEFFILNLSIASELNSVSEVADSASPKFTSLPLDNLLDNLVVEDPMNQEQIIEAISTVESTEPIQSTEQLAMGTASEIDKKKSMSSMSDKKDLMDDMDDMDEEIKKQKIAGKGYKKEKMTQSSQSEQSINSVSIEQLLSQIQSLSNQMNELSSSYQARIKDADEKLAQALSINAQLEERLRQTEVRTHELISQAQSAELAARRQQYLSQGVPPFIVNKIFDLIQANPSQQIRLSTGAQATLQSQLEDILSSYPKELRVSFQQFSSANVNADSAPPENPYRKAGIIK